MVSVISALNLSSFVVGRTETGGGGLALLWESGWNFNVITSLIGHIDGLVLPIKLSLDQLVFMVTLQLNLDHSLGNYSEGFPLLLILTGLFLETLMRFFLLMKRMEEGRDLLAKFYVFELLLKSVG